MFIFCLTPYGYLSILSKLEGIGKNCYVLSSLQNLSQRNKVLVRKTRIKGEREGERRKQEKKD